jgi:hypothetical protein
MDQGDADKGIAGEFEAHFYSKEKNINMRLANVGRGFKNQFLSLSAMRPIRLAGRWRTTKLKKVASIPTPMKM